MYVVSLYASGSSIIRIKKFNTETKEIKFLTYTFAFNVNMSPDYGNKPSLMYINGIYYGWFWSGGSGTQSKTRGFIAAFKEVSPGVLTKLWSTEDSTDTYHSFGLQFSNDKKWVIWVERGGPSGTDTQNRRVNVCTYNESGLTVVHTYSFTGNRYGDSATLNIINNPIKFHPTDDYLILPHYNTLHICNFNKVTGEIDFNSKLVTTSTDFTTSNLIDYGFFGGMKNFGLYIFKKASSGNNAELNIYWDWGFVGVEFVRKLTIKYTHVLTLNSALTGQRSYLSSNLFGNNTKIYYIAGTSAGNGPELYTILLDNEGDVINPWTQNVVSLIPEMYYESGMSASAVTGQVSEDGQRLFISLWSPWGTSTGRPMTMPVILTYGWRQSPTDWKTGTWVLQQTYSSTEWLGSLTGWVTSSMNFEIKPVKQIRKKSNNVTVI